MISSPGTGPFWAFSALVLVLLHLSGHAAYRLGVLALANGAFVWLASSHGQALGFLAFVGASWALLQLAGRAGPTQRASDWFRAALVIPVALAFLGHKIYQASTAGAVGAWAEPLQVLSFVGMAYAFLRYVHIAIDICEEGLVPPGLVEYTAFIQPWFMAVAGPIQRLQDFRRCTQTPPVWDREIVARAIERICRGLLKSFAIAPAILQTNQWLPSPGLAHWILASNLFIIYLYFDFSGYTDIAVGLGTLAGWQPPENFDRPWQARNMLELWPRWHMSLSLWSRDYIFTPLSRKFGRRLKPLTMGALAYSASLLVLALWHGLSGGYVLYGVVMAMAIWTCKAWEVLLRRRLGMERFRRYRQSWTIRGLVYVVNAEFFAITCLLMDQLVFSRFP